jgi:hypothetical protein
MKGEERTDADVCRPCKERVDVDNGVALWKVLHDARKEK